MRKKMILITTSLLMMAGFITFAIASDCTNCVINPNGPDECLESNPGYDGCMVYKGKCSTFGDACSC